MFRAGAATSNITPELGIDIVGGFVPSPATHVHDELHARCLVLDDGKTKIALVVCDLLGMHRNVSLEARKQIQEATGIPSDNVLISCTHTHSAGTALGERDYESEQVLDTYQLFVAKRISDGVRRATNLLRPAEIAFGTVDVPEHLFNRRWLMKEGTAPVNPFGKIDLVKMNPPGGSPNLVEPVGPTDPSISLIALREPNGRMISVYSAYSLHYVGGVGEGHISADYYGMYCEALKKLQNNFDEDPPFVAAMANGTSGDVNNINFLKPRASKPKYAQMRYVAEDAASKVHGALANLTWKNQAELRATYRELDIPRRVIDDELLAWVQQTEANITSQSKKSDLSIIYAARIKKLAKATPTIKIPLQVFRIGDICIGTSPCETFTETGLEFKQRSGVASSFMVELAHGSFGYLPTPRHFKLGGYETWPGTNQLESHASEKIMDALLEMNKTLK
ncbi:MAG: neutral/alkaline non-lysosomal ceramidase N-terminal domain-containing protein [Pirellulaceae bacterium]|nr:neutral/alkaline non-lysosomal ceramidase N-terminal domain-containing protein [Pirellulaceae bacterium]